MLKIASEVFRRTDVRRLGRPDRQRIEPPDFLGHRLHDYALHNVKGNCNGRSWMGTPNMTKAQKHAFTYFTWHQCAARTGGSPSCSHTVNGQRYRC